MISKNRHLDEKMDKEKNYVCQTINHQLQTIQT